MRTTVPAVNRSSLSSPTSHLVSHKHSIFTTCICIHPLSCNEYVYSTEGVNHVGIKNVERANRSFALFPPLRRGLYFPVMGGLSGSVCDHGSAKVSQLWAFFFFTFGLCRLPPQGNRRDESRASDGDHGLVSLDVPAQLIRPVLDRSVRRASHRSPTASRRDLYRRMGQHAAVLIVRVIKTGMQGDSPRGSGPSECGAVCRTWRQYVGEG